MSHSNVHSAPTPEQIEREVLYLEYYGSKASECLTTNPVYQRSDAHHQAAFPSIRDALAAEGWEFSGAGYFSAVFVKGGLALKVGFKPEDSGATYAAWCRANQGLAGVPRIYAVDKFTNCYVVLTDRYYSLENKLDCYSPEFDESLDQDITDLRDVLKGASPRSEIEVTAQKVHEFFNGIATIDLHSENVMMDREGNIILTDPLSFSYNRGRGVKASRRPITA